MRRAARQPRRFFDLWSDLPAEGHEGVKDKANDMEAVSDDAVVREPFFDEMAVSST
jgi:hypothetical protein